MRKLSLAEEKKIYEKQWQEVLLECENGIVDRLKISTIMQKLNIIDLKIMKNETR